MSDMVRRAHPTRRARRPALPTAYCSLLTARWPHQAVGSGKPQQRGVVGHRGAVDAVAGQGVEHIQELVAVVLHRPEAAPAGHPGHERQRGASPCAPAQPARVTGPMHRYPCSSRQCISLRGRPGSKWAFWMKRRTFFTLPFAFPDGGAGVADALGGQVAGPGPPAGRRWPRRSGPGAAGSPGERGPP